MEESIIFSCTPYKRLSLDELYKILKLRQEVFIVEQECAYLDSDGLDKAAFHVLSFDDKINLIAYARLLPKGIVYEDYQSIGRIITAKQVRGLGIGKSLVKSCIKYCEQIFGNGAIKISAQSHLIPFYNQFGFRVDGEGYLEDNIPHHAMIRSNYSS